MEWGDNGVIFAAGGHEGVPVDPLEGVELRRDGVAHGADHGVRVAVGAAQGLVHHVVDDAEVEVELSTGVKVRVVRPTISQVRSKTEPAAAND